MSLTESPNTVTVMQPGDEKQFDTLRDQLAENVPAATGMLLLATDGLARCAYGLPDDQDDTLAAASSGLASLATGAAKALGDSRFKHINITLENHHMIVTTCGEGSALVVMLPLNTRLGDALRETVRIAAAFRPRMDTEPRSAGS
ncbi:roadblock/LC7 domain-containing protein [Streptomyces anulatus]|uniref:roadblock/LC7 domain-containing protein n=1 Tax=Streptomyces anulatus TaxID=1892 RepID=UPI002E36E551|nr:roadblock/LC7 domain-containing protein [Streptomyces anulatus]